jgi:trans-2,3-dihydro-3-hydroxyanthranilate isomerase
MNQFSFAQYDAFTDSPFGGSQAAVVADAQGIDKPCRQQIAIELGLPATAFINGIGEDWVEVQFMSTVMELPMCGHGTICLVTYLFESNLLKMGDEASKIIQLKLPKGSATVEVSRRADDRFRVLLDIQPPQFKPAPNDNERLATILGIGVSDFSQDLPLESAHGDFIHLVVPLQSLNSVRRVEPDFDGIVQYCHDYGIETVVVFSQQVEIQGNSLHLRDFCPAVGVAESAAAGTTNAALTSYLIRHSMVQPTDGVIHLTAEQGHEINRPSRIESTVLIEDGEIKRLQVGGVATKILQGQLFL